MNDSTSSRGRTRRQPPTSLPDHFARKGYLSVSDLVGPSWCEYNYQYGVLSLSHLPPSQRPTTITTEAGQTLAAAPQLVAKKDATLTAGKAVHTVLEREVAPAQVYVETETKEDAWALRLLNLWCDVQALLQLQPAKGKGKEKKIACVREVPVYGWIHGVLVMGVIDEIEKRSIELQPQEKQPGKTWTSQEEWKKDQLRSKASPKKPKSNDTATRTLTSFFGSQSDRTSNSKTGSEQTTQSKTGWGYFLSDTKTRISSWLPAEEDQHSARMQCMTYKRLFDGLLLGALSSPSTLPSSQPDIIPSFDPNTTGMDWTQTFSALDLDQYQPLSTAFLRDAEPLCASWGADLTLFVAHTDADVCTLHHIKLLLEQGLRDLVADAQRGGGVDGEEDGMMKVEVIQSKLALTYRRQSQHKRRKRKKAAQGLNGKNDTGNGSKQATLHDVTPVAVKQDGEEKGQNGVESDIELPTVENANEASTEAQKSIDALEGRTEASNAIKEAFSSPTPCTPRKPSQPALNPTSPTSPTTQITPSPPSPTFPKADNPTIIGIVTFTYDPLILDKYLHRMIAMWKGERALVGVSLDQTRRCWTCEWMEGCEWRSAQSDRHRGVKQRPQTRAKILIREQDNRMHEEDEEDAGEEFWSRLDLDSIEVRDAAGNLLDW
ncbi:uncharacterized protein UTRI_05343 [Ustilago trichophora]|uniref:Exonuclease V n=1 Tax=Ustilago trichophora TaxID=86804 RepID=A0A5C3EM31_9BASI|nr:uncharacterized protein UTRI_05343 [Ustilago trichophora]